MKETSWQFHFHLVNMNDHELAKWLREHGWTGETIISGVSTQFLNQNKISICTIFYNNENCTKRIYLRKE